MFDEKTKHEAYRLFKWGAWVVAILGLFLLAQTFLSLKALGGNDVATNVISVNGMGEVYAVPDVASFSFTVSADAKNVSDAQKSVTEKMDAIIEDLKDLGIEEKDIKTNDYSVNPKYTYAAQPICTSQYCGPSNPVADGYSVSHSVVLKIRKTDDAGKALAAVGARGATNVSGISFTTDDPDQSQNEARALAIEDAQAKAEELADRLDVKLVRVTGFYESNSNGPYPMYDVALGGMGTKSASVAPTLPVGQNKIISNVTVNYEIR